MFPVELLTSSVEGESSKGQHIFWRPVAASVSVETPPLPAILVEAAAAEDDEDGKGELFGATEEAFPSSVGEEAILGRFEAGG